MNIYLRNISKMAFLVLFSYCQNEDTEIDQVTETTKKEEIDLPIIGSEIPPVIIEEVDPCNIILDPNNSAPLSAVAEFRTKDAYKISIKIKGQQGISQTFNEFNTDHEVPILGLYPDRINEIEISGETISGNIFNAKCEVETEPICKGIQNPTETCFIENSIKNILKCPGRLSQEHKKIFYLINHANHTRIIDHYGNIRWFFESKSHIILPILIFPLKNGNLFLSRRPKERSPIMKENVEMDLLGNIKQRFENINLHHWATEMPNGNILSLKGNSIVEFDRNTGRVIKEWHLEDILDNRRYIEESRRFQSDTFHINSVVFDPKDTSMIISMRHQNAVAKIDYETSEVIWILGDHSNWENNLSTKLLSPHPEFTQDDWPIGQHSALVLPNGNIALFDNHRIENLFANEDIPSRLVEYKIDETKKTISKVLDYTDSKENRTSPNRGGIDYSETIDGYLINWYLGTRKGLIQQVNRQSQIFFEVEFSSSFYRADFFSFYAN